ncbi:dna repair and recombination protein rhm52 [Lentinula edodes]|uniref:Dna repair and recombination protein rhm52 n=1 Tax=Lentinula edodes TaxID=5353 RepID=A0A1Q3DYA2_LENED|nr:dna repair and recombination protein rhm52 [Lentinula edodes]
MNLSKATSIKIASLQAKLNQQLGPEYISTRPGPGGGPKLVYAEGWKIINLANEVFGFNGWSSNLVSLTTDFIDYNEETRRYSVGVTAILRVTLRDGVFHEDIGYGILENSKTKGPALDKCKKEAVTDALKRSLRNFGNLLGNCLYDKQYTNEIVKIKVPPPKFEKENLHRRPEFSTDMNKAAPSPATNNTSKPATSGSTATKVDTTASAVKSEPAPSKPISSIPHHVREQVRLSLQESSSSRTTPNPPKPNISATQSDISSNVTTPTTGPSNRGSAIRHAAIIHGLNTPITTPAALQPIPRILPPQQAQDTPNHRQVMFADSPLANKVTAVANTLPAPPGESSDDLGAGDDSFALGSEDDAFFASVDLGNADMGRPIGFTEGPGNGGNQERGQHHLSTSASHQKNIQSTHLNPASSSSSATSSPAMTHNSSKVLPPLHPRKDGHRNQILPHQAQRPAPTSKGSDTPDRQTHPDAISSNTARDPTKVVATSTPAPRRMGGFSFPPDLLNRQPQQPQQGIGMKRPAEAMRTPVNAATASRDRRHAQGMGLMTAQGAGITRQQFNQANAQGLVLDREEGGDAKRMKY